MIKPTVGRSLHYYQWNGVCHTGPYLCLLCKVVSDDRVNLSVFSEDGVPRPAVNVKLVQDGEPVPCYAYCAWMPYQVGQAKHAS